MILTDSETKVDLLNNEAIASTIVKLLRDRPDKPVTIGVHGDWGAGKSSVLEMIEAQFLPQKKVLCLKFNGWRFQGFEDAKIALIEGIVTGLIEARPALKQASAAVKEVFKRIDWLKIAKKAGGLALTAFTGIPTPEQVQSIVQSLRNALANPGQVATRENIESAIEGVGGFLKPMDGESTNVPAEIGEFRKAFDELLNQAGVEQLVVLIDDLDRCLPDTAIETLEAIRLFVFTSRTAFVVAADESMIEYAVRKHFPDLPDSSGPQGYAKSYLEKLIQVPFRIPALGESETRIYVTLLLIGAELGEDHPAFEKLIGVARDALRRPWIGTGLDPTVIKTTLGQDFEEGVQAALNLSDQIGPILASGTKGNPRQIKRFLNSMTLRARTAEARGFEKDVKIPTLAKLMLAERFIPTFFDQIAAAAAADPQGCCADLAALEEAVATTAPIENGKDEDAPKSAGKAASKGGAKKQADEYSEDESTLLAEWRSSATIKSWALVRPKIGSEDLRPYLFVAKDRKDYFGATSALGQLASVVEQLLGKKMVVVTMSEELKKLAVPEARQVFESVRSRIMAGGSFDTAPAGADGLAVLVKAQPLLQGQLLDFLERLPRAQLGPWACSGWEGVNLNPEQAARFDKLLQAWNREGGLVLKAAANNVLRTRKKGG